METTTRGGTFDRKPYGLEESRETENVQFSLPLDVVVAPLRKLYFTPLRNSRGVLVVQFSTTTKTTPPAGDRTRDQ